MITKPNKTIAVINSWLICLSVLIISISANAMISGSATIQVINKLLKKVNTPNRDIECKYPSDVEEYSFTMRVSDPKDCCFERHINKSWYTYKCRFSIFRNGTTKIEYYNNNFEGWKNKHDEEFLDSVNNNSNEFKESLKEIVRNIEFTDQVFPYKKNYVTFTPNLTIKNDGGSNFCKTAVMNEGGSL